MRAVAALTLLLILCGLLAYANATDTSAELNRRAGEFAIRPPRIRPPKPSELESPETVSTDMPENEYRILERYLEKRKAMGSQSKSMPRIVAPTNIRFAPLKLKVSVPKRKKPQKEKPQKEKPKKRKSPPRITHPPLKLKLPSKPSLHIRVAQLHAINAAIAALVSKLETIKTKTQLSERDQRKVLVWGAKLRSLRRAQIRKVREIRELIGRLRRERAERQRARWHLRVAQLKAELFRTMLRQKTHRQQVKVTKLQSQIAKAQVTRRNQLADEALIQWRAALKRLRMSMVVLKSLRSMMERIRREFKKEPAHAEAQTATLLSRQERLQQLYARNAALVRSLRLRYLRFKKAAVKYAILRIHEALRLLSLQSSTPLRKKLRTKLEAQLRKLRLVKAKWQQQIDELLNQGSVSLTGSAAVKTSSGKSSKSRSKSKKLLKQLRRKMKAQLLQRITKTAAQEEERELAEFEAQLVELSDRQKRRLRSFYRVHLRRINVMVKRIFRAVVRQAAKQPHKTRKEFVRGKIKQLGEWRSRHLARLRATVLKLAKAIVLAKQTLLGNQTSSNSTTTTNGTTTTNVVSQKNNAQAAVVKNQAPPAPVASVSSVATNPPMKAVPSEQAAVSKPTQVPSKSGGRRRPKSSELAAPTTKPTSAPAPVPVAAASKIASAAKIAPVQSIAPPAPVKVAAVEAKPKLTPKEAPQPKDNGEPEPASDSQPAAPDTLKRDPTAAPSPAPKPPPSTETPKPAATGAPQKPTDAPTTEAPKEAASPAPKESARPTPKEAASSTPTPTPSSTSSPSSNATTAPAATPAPTSAPSAKRMVTPRISKCVIAVSKQECCQTDNVKPCCASASSSSSSSSSTSNSHLSPMSSPVSSSSSRSYKPASATWFSGDKVVAAPAAAHCATRACRFRQRFLARVNSLDSSLVETETETGDLNSCFVSLLACRATPDECGDLPEHVTQWVDRKLKFVIANQESAPAGLSVITLTQ